MPTYPNSRLTVGTPSRQKGALGIFQLLGLGLLLMFVVFVLIVVIRGLFT